MRKLNELISTFNNSVIQKKVTFSVPKTSLNHRVLRSLWRLNYLSVVIDGKFILTATHLLDNDGNPVIRNIKPLYTRTGRKYVSIRYDGLKKVVQYRGGDTLLLVSQAEDGLIWANEAYRRGIGGILLLQVYY